MEELSVKYYDDRVRGFPAFAFQHNPLTRILSLRNSITDLEQAQEQVFGSRTAAANYVLNHFPGSEILSLYLRGFPDRFRDQLNQAVTTDQKYVRSWKTVVNRVEEMLCTWNRTRDVVYIGLLAQIKSKKAQGNNGAAGVGNGKQGVTRVTGREKLYPGSTLGLDFINSIGEIDTAAAGEEERNLLARNRLMTPLQFLGATYNLLLQLSWLRRRMMCWGRPGHRTAITVERIRRGSHLCVTGMMVEIGRGRRVRL